MRYRLMYERQAYERAGRRLPVLGRTARRQRRRRRRPDGRTTPRVARAAGRRGPLRPARLRPDRRGRAVARGDGRHRRRRPVRAATPSRSSSPPAASRPTRSGAAEHLGPGWEHAKVRGTPYNTGDMIAAALARRRGAAAATGRRAHCGAVGRFTRHNESNRELTNRLTRQSYPLGIIVNRDGKRFLDEGADFRNYTYAKYGKEILRAAGLHRLPALRRRPAPDAARRGVRHARASRWRRPTPSRSWPADRHRPGGASPPRSTTFNASIDLDAPFDPTIKDGRRADVDAAEEQLGRRRWRPARSTPTR